MRFTDRKTHFTDHIPLLSIRSIRTDRQTVYDHSCHENILSPTNEMRFTDRKTIFTDRIPLLSIRSIRTDRHMAYMDRYGAGVLDNPRLNKASFIHSRGDTKSNITQTCRPYSVKSRTVGPSYWTAIRMKSPGLNLINACPMCSRVQPVLYFPGVS